MARLWAYSGAWMLYGAGLMAVGIGRADRALRLAALAIIGLVTGKVFLIDMADLAGCGGCCPSSAWGSP